jgi:adenosine deaminase
MLSPLPVELVRCVVPVVAGDGRRSDVLDVDLDGAGPVTAARFPVPLAAESRPLIWTAPVTPVLIDELRRRERAGSQLLGNFLETLARDEHHENWRSLYRLPPRLIRTLRETPLSPAHRDWLVALPKADLHRHLGGCLSLFDQRSVGAAIWDALSNAERETALLAVRPLLESDEWPWDWPSRLQGGCPRSHAAAALLTQAPEDRLEQALFTITEPRLALRDDERGFPAYERPGELSGSAVLGHPAAHRPYAAAVVHQAIAEGLAYLELRGSPQKYGDGLAFLRSFHAALNEALLALPDGERPRIRFILIADRRHPAQAREVIQLALKAQAELPDFIAGLDLAGDEKETRPADIAGDFLPAFEACLPLTIHAGEGEEADAIWQAAYHLHADRIGHGLSLGDHPQLAARFRNRGICLELCPTSNREVVGFRDPAHPASEGLPVYPLRTLWNAGLPLTLCTDNPGISRTTLADEYLTAARMVDGLTLWDALAMMRQAFVHAFLPGAERELLLKQTDTVVYRNVLGKFGG